MTDPFFQPPSGTDLPRYAGVPSFMRLPYLAADDPRRAEVDIGFFGLPWDGATSNRPGERHGPRALRDYSTMIREMNRVTGQKPFVGEDVSDTLATVLKTEPAWAALPPLADAERHSE